MSNAPSMGSSRRNAGGTIVGFKVTLLSLAGLMVATVVLQQKMLVYFMVLFPAVAGILSGLVVGSAGIAGSFGEVPRWLLVGIAVVTDIVAIVAAYLLF